MVPLQVTIYSCAALTFRRKDAYDNFGFFYSFVDIILYYKYSTLIIPPFTFFWMIIILSNIIFCKQQWLLSWKSNKLQGSLGKTGKETRVPQLNIHGVVWHAVQTILQGSFHCECIFNTCEPMEVQLIYLFSIFHDKYI